LIVFRTIEEFLRKASQRCGGDWRNKNGYGVLFARKAFEGAEGENWRDLQNYQVN